MSAPRRIGALALLAVAGIAAWISYWHAVEVALAHGEAATSAHLLPGTVDGLVVASSVVLWHSARRGRRGPVLAYFALALGIGATLAANVMHGIAHGVVGAVVGAWPAVALVFAYELLMYMIRDDARGDTGQANATQLADGWAYWTVPAALLPASSPAFQDVPPAAPALTPLQVRALAAFRDELEAGHAPRVRTVKTRLSIGSGPAAELAAFLRSRVRS